MKTNPDRSLKSVNMKWLVMLAVLDLFLVLFFVAPEIVKDATINQLAVMRGLTTSVLPVVVLLLAGMLSHDMKATLVYWKLTNALPGCQAFSRYGPGDSRIDMVALKKNVGELRCRQGHTLQMAGLQGGVYLEFGRRGAFNCKLAG